MDINEQEWERLLGIKTAGRDDSHSDGEHHPYEPTDYCVLERLANSGYLTKRDFLLDYGSGKGRVSFFLAYQTKCHALGIEYDERLYRKALQNKENALSGRRVGFVLADASTYDIPDEADSAFFFNPFALHTLKRVLHQFFDSLARKPRKLRLFFYYPDDDTLSWLENHPRLSREEMIDCQDLFPEKEDRREKVWVYMLC